MHTQRCMRAYHRAAELHTRPSPATGNINILLFPAQCGLRVTVDLTPELHALVN